MKKRFLVLLIMLSGIFCSAQNLHIAQDINHCAFGLKNDSDKWVVRPQFVTIAPSERNEYRNTRFSGWIISPDGIHYGLLDSAGKILFPSDYKSVGYYYARPVKNLFEPDQPIKIGNDSDILIPEYPYLHRPHDYEKTPDEFPYVFSFNNYQMGLADSSGNVLTNKLYHYIEPFQNGYAKVEVNNQDHYLSGFVDKNGNEIVSPIYSSTSPATKYGVYVSNDSLIGFVRWKDGKFIPEKMSYEQQDNDSVFLGKIGKKYGLLDDRGKTLVKAEYDGIRVGGYDSKNLNGVFRVWKDEISKDSVVTRKTGLVNSKGKFLLKPECDSVEYFEEGYDYKLKQEIILWHCVIFSVSDHAGNSNQKWGVASDSVGVILKPVFTACGWEDKAHEYFWGLKGNRIHVYKVNRKGAKEVLFTDFFRPTENDSSITFTGYLQTIITDKNGKLISPSLPWMRIERDPDLSFNDTLSIIQSRKGFGISEFYENKIIIPPVYKMAGPFGCFFQFNGQPAQDDGFIYVETFGGHYGIFTSEGKTILDTIYSTVSCNNSNFNYWIAYDSVTNHWSLFDVEGKIIATSKEPFLVLGETGKIIIDNGNYHDLYDAENGKYIFKDKFVSLQQVTNDLYIAENKNSLSGVVGTNGDTLYPFEYFSILNIAENVLLLKNDSGYAFAATDEKNFYCPLSDSAIAFRNFSLADIITSQTFYWPGYYTMEITPADTSLHVAGVKVGNNYMLDDIISSFSGEPDYSDDDINPPLNPLITINSENNYYDMMDFGSQEKTYAVESATDVTFTISTDETFWHGGGGNEDFKMTTYLFRGDSIFEISLDDILRSDTSLASLNDSIHADIMSNNEEGFFFDCSNPETLSPEYFVITPDGIRLYYRNESPDTEEYYYYDGDPIIDKLASVTLFWKTLDKFLKPGCELKKIYCSEKKKK